MTFKNFLTLILFAAITSAYPLRPSLAPLAPFYIPDAPPHDIINDTYIVMFQDDITPGVFSSHIQFLHFMDELNPVQTQDEEESSGVNHIYDSIVAKGYSGKFSEEVVNMIRMRPEVKYVEQDSEIHLDIVRNDEEEEELQSYGYDVQKQAPWVCTCFSHQFEGPH